MNPETNKRIKNLSKRLSVSLGTALQLIKENGDNIEACETAFHKNNMNTICRLGECDESVAKELYYRYSFDVEKTIKRINEQATCLTPAPNKTCNKIGFLIWEEGKFLHKYKTIKNRKIFIQDQDFSYVKGSFQKVFPLKNPYTNELENQFDPCLDHVFDNQTCRLIVKEMAGIKTTSQSVELFLRKLIRWFNFRLEYADYIIVSGNL